MQNVNENHPESYWTNSIDLPEFPQLNEDQEVDVTIVGGGITGITTAYLLVKEGLKVSVLESTRLMNGTTGHTTAKVTMQHDLIYNELIENLGEEKARAYYDANNEAFHFIKNTIQEHDIDCAFTEQDAIIYATTEKYEKEIQKEAEAYDKLGIPGELVHEIPLDMKIRNAIVMKNQAQFHPLQYLSSLVQIIKEKGGLIYENTTAVKVEKGDSLSVLTRGGSRITSKHVLACSHFPFYEGLGLYATRLYAERSYVLATKTKKPFPGGMYLSADSPTHSLRSVSINGEELVLIGGESHKTGQDSETKERYKALETFGEEVFGLEEIPYHWSAQDLTTLDKVPYIGEITPGEPRVLIATGFRKWGMTNSAVAALLFRDRVLGVENGYEKLFTPTRFPLKPSLKSVAQVNADTISQLVKGKLETSEVDSNALSHDEGAIITVNGQRKGAYKDKDGKLFVIDTTCTHAGCEVNWNDGERTWDCPCHGSRFSYTGEVIEGPAEKPLQTYDYKMIDNITSEDSGY